MKLLKRLITAACVTLFPFASALGESPESRPVPESVQAKVGLLFQKYYPAAKITNQQVNGFHVEFKATTFELPRADHKGKQENPTQRGPQNGGIMCSIYMSKGEYAGQLALLSGGDGRPPSALIDKKFFKQLLMAPHSAKRDAHLWVALSYPSDTSDAFLNEFTAIMKAFASDAD